MVLRQLDATIGAGPPASSPVENNSKNLLELSCFVPHMVYTVCMETNQTVTINLRIDGELLARIQQAVDLAGPEWDRSSWIRDTIRRALDDARTGSKD